MYELLLALIIVLFATIKVREHLGLRLGGSKIITTDTSGDIGDGYEVVSTWPDTCPAGTEYISGLCYPKCKLGYYRSALSCVAESWNSGTGRILLLKSCAQSGYSGWTNTGLLCNEPLKWVSCANKIFGACLPGLVGGRVRERRLSCAGYDGEFPERSNALCFKSCPKDYPQRMAFPLHQLCYKGGPLMYTDVGKIPNTIAWNDREGGIGGN